METLQMYKPSIFILTKNKNYQEQLEYWNKPKQLLVNIESNWQYFIAWVVGEREGRNLCGVFVNYIYSFHSKNALWREGDVCHKEG